jgi:hypothetical protein
MESSHLFQSPHARMDKHEAFSLLRHEDANRGGGKPGGWYPAVKSPSQPAPPPPPPEEEAAITPATPPRTPMAHDSRCVCVCGCGCGCVPHDNRAPAVRQASQRPVRLTWRTMCGRVWPCVLVLRQRSDQAPLADTPARFDRQLRTGGHRQHQKGQRRSMPRYTHTPVLIQHSRVHVPRTYHVRSAVSQHASEASPTCMHTPITRVGIVMCACAERGDVRGPGGRDGRHNATLHHAHHTQAGGACVCVFVCVCVWLGCLCRCQSRAVRHLCAVWHLPRIRRIIFSLHCWWINASQRMCLYDVCVCLHGRARRTQCP